jgi:hypothetical protein
MYQENDILHTVGEDEDNVSALTAVLMYLVLH